MKAPEKVVQEDPNVVHEDRGPYVAVTAGHAAIDVFNSMGPVLLAFLRTPMALSNAEVGLAVGTYQFLAGATQPGFGWLADRIGSRWMGPLSVAWAVGLVAVAERRAVVIVNLALERSFGVLEVRWPRWARATNRKKPQRRRPGQRKR